MNTFRSNRLLGLFLAIIVAGLGLTGCSEDTPHAPAPATDTLNESNAADLWQNALDEVAAMEGGAAMLAELAPQIEAARAAYNSAVPKHRGARLFFAIDRTEVTLVPPFPPPHVNLEIDYFGVGTMIGRHTGFSPLTHDSPALPARATTTAPPARSAGPAARSGGGWSTWTRWDGLRLECPASF